MKQTYSVLCVILVIITVLVSFAGISSIANGFFIVLIVIFMTDIIDLLTKMYETNKKTQELLEKQLSNAHQQTK